METQKSACEVALKKELTYQSGYGASGLKSGFMSPDVFSVSFVSSNKKHGDINYFYNLRAEGIWRLALEDDPSSGCRFLESKRIVDAYNVVDLGILSADQAEPSPFIDLHEQQHIELSGKAFCSFFSEDSKTPKFVYIRPGRW